MAQLSLSRAWDETAAILVREGGLLAAVALALVVLPQMVLAVVGVPVGPQATVVAEVTYAAAFLLGFVSQIAINRLAIGPSTSVRDAIAQGLVRLGPVLLVLAIFAAALVIIALVLAMILSAIGAVRLPGPGQPPTPSLIALLLLLTTLGFAIFQLVFPVAAVETGNPIRLISRSWQLARRQYLRLLAFLIVVFAGIGILALVGRLAIGTAVVLLLGQPNPGTVSALVLGLIIGLIQAAFNVTTAVMLARIYVQLSGRGEAQASVPSSGI